MTFETLQYGEVFHIDGAPFQVWYKGQRVLLCLHLTPEYDHLRDADGELLTSAFSDLRINQNNATPTECRAYLLELVQRNTVAA